MKKMKNNIHVSGAPEATIFDSWWTLYESLSQFFWFHVPLFVLYHSVSPDDWWGAQWKMTYIIFMLSWLFLVIPGKKVIYYIIIYVFIFIEADENSINGAVDNVIIYDVTTCISV